MPATIQKRVFARVVEAGNLEPAIAEVTSEVNAFLSTFALASRVLDVRMHTGPASKYGERSVHIVTVFYLEVT